MNHEPLALCQGIVSIGWQALSEKADLSKLQSRDELRTVYESVYGPNTKALVSRQVNQVWKFITEIDVGDLVVLPLAGKDRLFALGRVIGPFEYCPELPEDAKNTRRVKWLNKDIARPAKGSDLNKALSLRLTVFMLKEDDGDAIKALA